MLKILIMFVNLFFTVSLSIVPTSHDKKWSLYLTKKDDTLLFRIKRFNCYFKAEKYLKELT